MQGIEIDFVDPFEYDQVIKELDSFFKGKGFIQAYAQNRRSIMAACEDPTTMTTYNYSGVVWPLPQTNQMHLEVLLLEMSQKNARMNGLFCQTTSYRQEPNPVPGRHNLIFPMFEFEAPGTFEDLLCMEGDLLRRLGYPQHPAQSVHRGISGYPELKYDTICALYSTDELDHDHEQRLMTDYGHAAFITNFPEHTDPFWNMARKDDRAQKVDVIMSGIETIGSAERSTDKDQMRQNFLTISDGKYADKLFAEFGKGRVMKELDEFLALEFIPRYGGGIGVTRLIRSLNLLRASDPM
jgi:aspartyl/asparaginyl-tRNA synthetase